MGKANNKKEGITMKLGFIGTGNMASAIMGGIIKNQIILQMILSEQMSWKLDASV